MNKSRKITGILLACCALLMVAIAGLGVTLAKYTKSAEPRNDSAHVAKFGITLAWSSNDAIFKNTYTTTDSEKSATITNSVVSATDANSDSTMDNVIAPGTSGSVNLTISGTSEVAFTLAIQINEEYIGAWQKSATDATAYHPIEYSATSTDTIGSTNVELDAQGKFTIDIAAGTAVNATITISWEWPFESGSSDEEKAANDAADTYMSSVAGASYKITASATATQID